jgi:hypothetical protein
VWPSPGAKYPGGAGTNGTSAATRVITKPPAEYRKGAARDRTSSRARRQFTGTVKSTRTGGHPDSGHPAAKGYGAQPVSPSDREARFPSLTLGDLCPVGSKRTASDPRGRGWWRRFGSWSGRPTAPAARGAPGLRMDKPAHEVVGTVPGRVRVLVAGRMRRTASCGIF